MSKPYLIVNVVEGEVGQVWERSDWDSAIERAAELAASQCDVVQEDCRNELECDGNFQSPNGDIKVVICQTEDE